MEISNTKVQHIFLNFIGFLAVIAARIAQLLNVKRGTWKSARRASWEI